MARTSRVANPPSTVDALDSLNIDDIFAEGSDALFDGLDMDLGHMAELTADVDDSKPSKNGMEKLSTSGDAKPSDLSALSPSILLETDSSKRRKPKRRTRSPVLLEDEDFTMEAAKKKRRTSKAPPSKKGRATTPKATKKQPEKAAEPPSAPPSTIAAVAVAAATAAVAPSQNSKTKAKARTSSTMPPPVARNASGGPVSVAAAGKYGGTQRRGGHFALPLARVTTERQKAKAKAAESTKGRSTSLESAASSQSSEAPPPLPAAAPTPPPPRAPPPPVPAEPVVAQSEPRRESTFCGLLPSNSLFYPFMPALPVEPSMKNRPKLPVIERINAALTNQLNSSSSGEGDMPSGEPRGIYRLIMEGEQVSSTPSTSSSVPLEKHAAVMNSVASVLKVIASLDKGRLTVDLYSVCAMLKRQHDFLNQSLANMDNWCKDNFTEQDYALTYGAPDSAGSKKKKSVSETFTPLLFGLPSPFIKVKIKCNGFKEPKMSTPLTAMVPPSAVAVGVTATVVKKEVIVKPPAKKRKPPTVPDIAPTSDVTRGKEAEPVIPYCRLRPAQRRQRISESVATKAELLEARIRESEQSRRQVLLRRQAELQKVVDDGEVVVHTSAMWQWIEKSPYFAPFTEEDIKEVLRVAWTPETSLRGLYRSNTPQIEPEQNPCLERPEDSVFDKLQSLLIDEDGESGEADDDDPVLQMWYRSSEGVSMVLPNHGSVSDVSELSVDERTYLVLQSVGLIPNSVPPPSESSASSTNANNPSRTVSALEGNRDEIDELIAMMSTDLDSVCNLNSMRAAFLEATAKAYLETWEVRKKKTEEDNNSIAKCIQILKKSKENKTKSSRKSAGVRKDEDWIPW
jgi:hypothetical protein